MPVSLPKRPGMLILLYGHPSLDRKIRGLRLEVLRFRRDSFLDQPTSKTQRDVENEAEFHFSALSELIRMLEDVKTFVVSG